MTTKFMRSALYCRAHNVGVTNAVLEEPLCACTVNVCCVAWPCCLLASSFLLISLKHVQWMLHYNNIITLSYNMPLNLP